MILILSLSLILILSTTALSLPEVHAEDLKCLNDYESEMVCRLDLGKLQSCSEFSLTANLSTSKRYNFTCSFQLVSQDSCECQFQVKGFVSGETFFTELWKGGAVLVTKDMQTFKIIKPKKPINVSVEVTENGDFRISWSHNYTSTQKPFVESLRTNLSYGLKGSKDRVPVQLEQGRTYYELVGKKLQPNSDYIVTASVSSDYNDYQTFSDESDPLEFSTPPSLQSFLVIIIPISCIILILFIVIIFYCYIRIIKQWWNKIPTPKIAPSFEKPVLNWATFPNEFTPVYLDTVKLDLPKEKSWKAPSLIDVSCENSYHSAGKSGNSSHVIYGQAGFEDAEDGLNVKDLHCELLEDYQSTVRSLATSDSSKSGNNQREQSGNSSSFSNKCYLGSDSSGSSFLNRSITHPAYPSDGSENPFSSLSENLEPMIPTDFEYGPCNGCPESTDFILTQNTPPDTETVVVFGYQSVNDLQNNENKPEAVPDKFTSFHNDINMKIMPGCFISPQDFALFGCESDMIVPVDEGYQSCPSFQGQNSWSSDQSTDLEHSLSQTVTREQEQEHAPLFKSLCGPVLHVSPGIQIDCSYQRV
ncbi:interleukin-4 receptor subunit alpha isoform X1 [Astyanax mexicanus]|uniref:interleukin-4 receptor subunit alpha isoform X1 n=1 Tax=Astyanax mexicanus TaxID=7994 RepID=UPI0020CB5E04|nr:interleukin-4 receptor subunit alpha isoform X1 [Astyanax mexicanus]